MIVAITKETTTEHVVKLNADDLQTMLRNAGVPVPRAGDVRVFFHIPGGGDYSDEDIDISSDHPVHVRWTVQEKADG